MTVTVATFSDFERTGGQQLRITLDEVLGPQFPPSLCTAG